MRPAIKALLVAVVLSMSLSAPVTAGPLQAAGTLVLMVPSRQGLVIVADSRNSVAGIYCDKAFKIIEPASPPRVVFAVTGYGTFLPQPGSDVTDLCEYLRASPRLLDIEAVVKRFIETENADVATLRMDALAASCVATTNAFQAQWPDAIEEFRGHDIFTVVLAGYNLHTRSAVIRSFAVGLPSDSTKVRAERFNSNNIGLDSTQDVFEFGETDYLHLRVYGEPGRRFLTESTLQFLNRAKTVREIELDDALAVATNIIEAASNTTTFIPAPSGIGGPVDAVLLGENARPERLRWKTN